MSILNSVKLIRQGNIWNIHDMFKRKSNHKEILAHGKGGPRSRVCNASVSAHTGTYPLPLQRKGKKGEKTNRKSDNLKK